MNAFSPSDLLCSVGTGLMGSATAAVFAASGHPVSVWGRSEESLDRGRTAVEGALSVLEKNGLIRDSAAKALSRVLFTAGLGEAVGDASFIIESLSEDLELKRSFLAEIEDLCPPRALLASNTSGLMPTSIAERLRIPGRFLVTHFWNPAHLIPLVEICPGKATLPETTETARGLLLSLGKKPVILRREIPGFIGNRLQFAILREAIHIVETGAASMEDVDTAMKCSLGRRLSATGPFETADLGGLDVFASVASYLFRDLSSSPEAPGLLVDRVKAGHLGAKTGEGLFQWTAEKRRNILEARTGDLIAHMRKDASRG